MGAMVGPHGALTALLASMFAFGNHSLLTPGPEDNPYDPINTTESTLDEPPAPGAGDPPRKPVAEYLDYL
eukprot:10482267-Heterocapsa_arctica.AAC.1